MKSLRAFNFFLYFKEYFLNLNWGMTAFCAQRISGIALALYMILHFLTIGAARHGSFAMDESFAKWNNTIGHTMEYLLLICVLIHAFNGLRIIIADFFDLTEKHKRLLAWAAVCILAVALPSIFIFFK